MEELLKDACTMGHLAEVEELLAKGVDPNTSDETGNYPIHWCCSTKDLRCLEALLKNGALPNVRDGSENTPLHLAVQNGMESGIELLIKFNADITLKNGKKQTPSQMTKDKMVLSKFNAFVKDKAAGKYDTKPVSPVSPANTRLATEKPPTRTKSFGASNSEELSERKKKRASQALPDSAAKQRKHRSERPLTPSSAGKTPASAGMNVISDDIKAKQQLLNKREEELMLREEYIRRKETALEELKKRENELEEKLQRFVGDQSALRTQVEAQSANVLSSAIQIVEFSELKLKEKIGEGAFGQTFKGKFRGVDVAVKRAFAVHELPVPGSFTDADIADFFFRELKMLIKLRHPNIVLVMAACTDPKNRCIVMELAECDLFALLRSERPLSVQQRLRMALDCAAGLMHTHCCRPALIHRDVKSSNFLLDENWRMKLTDFGFCVARSGDRDFGFTNHNLTGSATKGTPAYMAPECLVNDGFSLKSDIYSFGIVLWELATRRIPWEGKEPTQIYAEVTTGNRLEVPESSGFPLEYIRLVKSTFVDSAKERPSMSAVVRTLRQIVRSAK